MHPVRRFSSELGISLVFSGDKEELVECEIIENDKLNSNKILLLVINMDYGIVDFYRDDFESMINMGVAIKKTSRKQHTEKIC